MRQPSWPQFSVPNGSDPDVLSASAPVDIKLGQPTIVIGDVDLLPDDPVAPACMVVNGAYVEIPWRDKFIPLTSFTLEAWVRVDWTANDPHAFRLVVDSREISPATASFGLCAKAVDDQPGVYAWRGIVGDGSPAFVTLDSVEAPFKLKDPAAAAGTTHYLALTYDADNVPRRPQPAEMVGSALFPFVGAIQDVAIYGAVLDSVPPPALQSRKRNRFRVNQNVDGEKSQ
jgi:hypothetical protein